MGLAAHGHVLAALGSNLLLLVTVPVIAWGAVALAGVGEVRGPWAAVSSRTWIGLGVFALVYTVLRNVPLRRTPSRPSSPRRPREAAGPRLAATICANAAAPAGFRCNPSWLVNAWLARQMPFQSASTMFG